MTALSPSVVAAIDDLELAARLVVEGLRVGGHRSPFHGYGAEFQQHRPYRAGDDLKYLDWKVYARSNRLYTRQFRETTNVSVMIVLDNFGAVAAESIEGTAVKHVITTRVGDMLPFPKSKIVDFTLKYVKKMIPAFSARAIASTSG